MGATSTELKKLKDPGVFEAALQAQRSRRTELNEQLTSLQAEEAGLRARYENEKKFGGSPILDDQGKPKLGPSGQPLLTGPGDKEVAQGYLRKANEKVADAKRIQAELEGLARQTKSLIDEQAQAQRFRAQTEQRLADVRAQIVKLSTKLTDLQARGRATNSQLQSEHVGETREDRDSRRIPIPTKAVLDVMHEFAKSVSELPPPDQINITLASGAGTETINAVSTALDALQRASSQCGILNTLYPTTIARINQIWPSEDRFKSDAAVLRGLGICEKSPSTATLDAVKQKIDSLARFEETCSQAQVFKRVQSGTASDVLQEFDEGKATVAYGRRFDDVSRRMADCLDSAPFSDEDERNRFVNNSMDEVLKYHPASRPDRRALSALEVGEPMAYVAGCLALGMDLIVLGSVFVQRRRTPETFDEALEYEDLDEIADTFSFEFKTEFAQALRVDPERDGEEFIAMDSDFLRKYASVAMWLQSMRFAYAEAGRIYFERGFVQYALNPMRG